MPELTMPQIRVDGDTKELRDLTREDIAKMIPEIDLSKVDLPKKIKLPEKIDLSQIDMSKLELPKKVELPDRIELPKVELRQRRSGLPGPLIAIMIVGAIAAAWALMTVSPFAPRLRQSVDDLRVRVDRWRSGQAFDDGAFTDEDDRFGPDAADPTGVVGSPANLPESTGPSHSF